MLERRELRAQVRIDRRDGAFVPPQPADIHEARPRGVPVFHVGTPRQPEVQIIMGEEDRRQPGVTFGLVPLEPEDLRGGKADGRGDPQPGDGPPPAPERGHDLVRLADGRGIVPELGRPDDAALGVERDEAVLLARDADSDDLPRIDLGLPQGRGHGSLCGRDPDGRILFARAGAEPRDHNMGGLPPAENPAGSGVDDQGFGSLGPGIDADGVLGHVRPRSARF